MIFYIDFISFILYDAFSVIIHNQYLDFELVSPAYFGHNVIWLKSPDQKVDTDTMIRANFGKSITKKEFTSALIYKLQRKKYLTVNLMRVMHLQKTH
jgi:hypothetical protein